MHKIRRSSDFPIRSAESPGRYEPRASPVVASTGSPEQVLASADRPPEADRSNEPLICVCVNGCALGHKRACCEVIAGSAREHDNLEVVTLLGKQRAKPVHPAIVAL